MEKEKSKVTSVRLSPRTLQAIDAYVQRHRYYKRNSIIDSVLGTIFIKCPDRFIEEIIWGRIPQEFSAKISSFTDKL